MLKWQFKLFTRMVSLHLQQIERETSFSHVVGAHTPDCVRLPGPPHSLRLHSQWSYWLTNTWSCFARLRKGSCKTQVKSLRKLSDMLYGDWTRTFAVSPQFSYDPILFRLINSLTLLLKSHWLLFHLPLWDRKVLKFFWFQ